MTLDVYVGRFFILLSVCIESTLTIASSKSTRVSLAGIRIGRYDLSEQRKNLLSRVPKSGDYVRLSLNSLEVMDLAYLSAKTGDEFAILRSKKEDVLFHGTATSCVFDGELEEDIRNHKYELIAHSHPGEEEPEPLLEDRLFLKEINQYSSFVVSGRTGRVTEFTSDLFE